MYDRRTAEQLGNVTSVHRELLETLQSGTAATWSAQALRACLDELRMGTGLRAEVRVEQAWVDGPDAFCVVYRSPYLPDERMGLRRQKNDEDLPGDRSGALFVTPMYGDADPINFGFFVASHDIGDHLGSSLASPRHDEQGVGWWGALEPELPRPPGPTPRPAAT